MRNIKPITEKRIIDNLIKGNYKRKRRPHILRIIRLDLAIKKYSLVKISKEIAYCLVTEVDQRISNERYLIAKSTLTLKDKEWSSIAVLQLKDKEIKSFSDLICINYKMIDNKEFRERNPKLIKKVIEELKQLMR